ncbi:hypothetical protein S7711_11073 [Stachybotrys chartarum IBT 7711]|uniref:Uncharacterized protein n=1 Tax=Stachybotrys chartarum (strain CBS 109288 / IBT 7711) TaxID=1280523 RepID=A0A084B5Q8_STACB|nr:hypothetical protein S7711_11073 [Stachybotrys chartarum IBT 7711]
MSSHKSPSHRRLAPKQDYKPDWSQGAGGQASRSQTHTPSEKQRPTVNDTTNLDKSSNITFTAQSGPSQLGQSLSEPTYSQPSTPVPFPSSMLPPLGTPTPVDKINEQLAERAWVSVSKQALALQEHAKRLEELSAIKVCAEDLKHFKEMRDAIKDCQVGLRDTKDMRERLNALEFRLQGLEAAMMMSRNMGDMGTLGDLNMGNLS